MASALNIVQKVFPHVTSVVDATKDAAVEVTKRDTTSATVRNHKACAMAVACKRKLDLDGVIMSVSTAYLIKGNKATRYRVPQSVSREIVAFDRDAVFEPGEYNLTTYTGSGKVGSQKGVSTSSANSHSSGLAKRFRHKTEGIRSSLGNKNLV